MAKLEDAREVVLLKKAANEVNRPLRFRHECRFDSCRWLFFSTRQRRRGRTRTYRGNALGLRCEPYGAQRVEPEEAQVGIEPGPLSFSIIPVVDQWRTNRIAEVQGELREPEQGVQFSRRGLTGQRRRPFLIGVASNSFRRKYKSGPLSFSTEED